MKLTKRNVDGIEPINKDVLHWDDESKDLASKLHQLAKRYLFSNPG